MKELLKIRLNTCWLKTNYKKLQKFNAAYFRGKSHFEEDGKQIFFKIFSQKFFSQCTDILKGLQVLVVAII